MSLLLFLHDCTLPHSICVRIISGLEHLSFSLFALFYLASLAKSSLFSLFCEPFFVGAYLETYFTFLT